LVLSLLLVLAGCVPIRQSMLRGNLLGDAPGTFNGSPSSPASLPGGPPSGDDWQSQMEGVASWYGPEFNGRLTASGEVYDMYGFTAAHRTLPLGTLVKVTDEENGKTVEVKVNDRGPFVKDRIIDLSKSACQTLDMMKTGTARVKLEVISWPAMANK
jgi:rare lipoprotein A